MILKYHAIASLQVFDLVETQIKFHQLRPALDHVHRKGADAVEAEVNLVQMEGGILQEISRSMRLCDRSTVSSARFRIKSASLSWSISLYNS